MKLNDIEELKKEYEEIDIPSDLDMRVSYQIRKYHRKQRVRKQLVAMGLLVFLFIGLVNYNSVVAKYARQIPIVNSLAKFVTFNEYVLVDSDRNVELNIDGANIYGLKNNDLASVLNKRYLKENKKLYHDFVDEIKLDINSKKINRALDVDYLIEVDTDKMLVIKQVVTHYAGSSEEIANYDTIDIKNQVLISLPSLFKDESYIDVISKDIKKQMQQQMKKDKEKSYFLEDFDKIAKNQKFYISKEGKLMIIFDSYTIAPGYMGVISFEIDSNKITDTLVSNYYIK